MWRRLTLETAISRQAKENLFVGLLAALCAVAQFRLIAMMFQVWYGRAAEAAYGCRRLYGLRGPAALGWAWARSADDRVRDRTCRSSAGDSPLRRIDPVPDKRRRHRSRSVLVEPRVARVVVCPACPQSTSALRGRVRGDWDAIDPVTEHARELRAAADLVLDGTATIAFRLRTSHIGSDPALT